MLLKSLKDAYEFSPMKVVEFVQSFIGSFEGWGVSVEDEDINIINIIENPAKNDMIDRICRFRKHKWSVK